VRVLRLCIQDWIDEGNFRWVLLEEPGGRHIAEHRVQLTHDQAEALNKLASHLSETSSKAQRREHLLAFATKLSPVFFGAVGKALANRDAHGVGRRVVVRVALPAKAAILASPLPEILRAAEETLAHYGIQLVLESGSIQMDASAAKPLALEHNMFPLDDLPPEEHKANGKTGSRSLKTRGEQTKDDSPPVTPPPEAIYLNTYFPDLPPGLVRLNVGMSHRLCVNLGPRRMEGAGASSAIAADALARMEEAGVVDVFVLCPGARIDGPGGMPFQRLSLPPDPSVVLDFTITPKVAGQLALEVVLLVENEAVFRSPLPITVVDPADPALLPTVATPVPAPPPVPHAVLLGDDRPRIRKLEVDLHVDRLDPNQLEVHLRVPLDPSKNDEAKAQERFGDILYVRHFAKVKLKEAREALSEAFEKLYNPMTSSEVHDLLTSPAIPEDRETSRKMHAAFIELAILGRTVYRRLFEPRELDSHATEDRDIVLSALRSALARPHYICIQSPEPLFPWTFLFDDAALQRDNLKSFEFGRFWGFRHVLQEEVRGTTMSIHLPSQARFVAAVCPITDDEGEHQRGPLAEIDATRMQWINDAEELKEKLSDFKEDILYFYGHATQDDIALAATSALRLKGYKLTADDIDSSNGPVFEQRPVLIFLNGCETRPLHDWDDESIAGLLCLRGDHRVSCITTVAEVPRIFGRHFARCFWEQFLQGKNVGESLLHARTELLASEHNPLGLLYTFFGRVETRLG